MELKSARIEVADSLEAVNELVCERRWGDGLPVVPPTEERVEKMVRYVGRDPQEVIAKVPPLDGVATVEMVAINAIMAGCLPEYMPVVIAAVEAMSEPVYNLAGLAVTTNAVAPVAIVNGPICKKLNINCGRGCLGPGWRANATIGRAIRLIIFNIGGAIPETVSKSLHASPGRYTFCFGEDEEGSPWEPLHVQRGLAKGTSAVTMANACGTQNVGVIHAPSAETMLRVVAGAMIEMSDNMTARQGSGEPLVVLTSSHASMLAAAGLSVLDVKRQLFRFARRPLAEVPDELKRELTFRVVDGMFLPCERAEDIIIVVAGAPDLHHVQVMPSIGITSRAVTKPVVE